MTVRANYFCGEPQTKGGIIMNNQNKNQSKNQNMNQKQNNNQKQDSTQNNR